ncbi:MAG: 3-hydroxyacyl-ACP dehydratase FabZ [SAR86 cluster bacterium]|uniref:3-hydroxyacyl-[acyl-carrier-protein] dehydratase FabZ n=1 Tax=SAR86 cluster bacterium TaxID=2030880 RepID=A0A937LI55_9GAMM|nr:3-hydroxyacyl-ACP dehydratase FabZ [SAR86 cluster bacterium]
MNREQIKSVLPHREPFLFLDEIVSVSSKEVVAKKKVSIEEDYFRGHFPNYPVMPGVLILEAMAQSCGVLGSHIMDKSANKNSVYLFAGIDKVRFKRKVLPGDVLTIKSKVLSEKRGIWKFISEAHVDKSLACKAEILCADRSLDE